MGKKKVKSKHKRRRNKKTLSTIINITKLITAIIKLVTAIYNLLKAFL